MQVLIDLCNSLISEYDTISVGKFYFMLGLFDTNKFVYNISIFKISPDFLLFKTINVVKELSRCHKLLFSNPNIFATRGRIPQIFQTINSVISDNQRFTSSDLKDIGIRKFEFVAKIHFLYLNILNHKLSLHMSLVSGSNCTSTEYMLQTKF